MKPSDKVLELLKKVNEEYLKAIETTEEDDRNLNAYLNMLRNFTNIYLDYKRKGK